MKFLSVGARLGQILEVMLGEVESQILLGRGNKDF